MKSTDCVTVTQMIIKPGESIRLNFEKSFGIIYLTSGVARLLTGNSDWIVKQGEYLLFGEKETARLNVSGNEEHPCELIHTIISIEYLEGNAYAGEDLCGCFRHPLLGSYRLIDSRHNTNLLLRDLLTRLSKIETGLFAVESYRHSISIIVVILAGRAFQSLVEATGRRAHHKLTINSIFYYIKDHIEDDLSLDHLSKKLFFNKFYIAHTFKKHTGISLRRFIIIKKLEHARELVMQGMSITDVHKRCGFNDCSHFIRAYKAMYGISPKKHYLQQTSFCREEDRRETAGISMAES